MRIKLIIDVTSSKADRKNGSYHFTKFTPADCPEKAFACKTWTDSDGVYAATQSGMKPEEIHETARIIGRREWKRLTSATTRGRDHHRESCPVRWINQEDLPEILAEIFTPEIT